MPHIFRFHKGRNNNIYDWKSSDRIEPADVRDVMDKTNILTSSAGTSIPTPIARMYLFKTAYEILAAQVRDNQVDNKSIYSGLVSESLDLLEFLYKSGTDEKRFRYYKWVFDNTQRDDNIILKFFGLQHGHRLLAESFKQAASQAPFNHKIEITFIYYRESNKEILLGGTSPFTFVFTTPNFKRKMRDRSFRTIAGLVSNDILFDSDYKQLHERDESFIKYIESLISSEGINNSFLGFSEYVINDRNRNPKKFNGTISSLQNIQFGNTPLTVSNINLKQISEADYKLKINHDSDFKIELPDDSNYSDVLNPLFLIDKMTYEGQYTSSSSLWSDKTRVSEIEYHETEINDIKERDLPGIDGFSYPFFAPFDFFERCLVSLPGYTLNNERFSTLIDNQTFIYPLKPVFFHLFPINKIKDYVSVEEKNAQVIFTIRIPVFGPTKGRREFVCKKTYEKDTIINYSGILGIFPFTRAIKNDLLHINKYTVASYEKTNTPIFLSSLKFFKKTGTNIKNITPHQRSNDPDLYTKTTYFQLNESFDIIQLNFQKDNSNCGGIIIPIFKEVENGDAEYVYAVDFGTSNTHIEYGKVENLGNRKQVADTMPFSIDEGSMQMYLLNNPKEVILNDGAEIYNDYERSVGFVIDQARKVTLREFIPFQIGNQKSASVKFPFRTATCESNTFISNAANNRLFIDANIGFFIDDDAMSENIRYKTDLKWLLQKASKDQFNINRVSLFAKELMLMIRTKVLLEEGNNKGNLEKLRVVLSFPISMGDTLRDELLKIFDKQRIEIFGDKSQPLAKYVTESIAPYYQLKSKNINIQNDNFCNIDIGGGTTDIVITDTDTTDSNKLQCYCSSFRFAGRQLWSSGSNEYNINDNGFVSYYKEFIKRIDPNQYGELQKLLNSSSIRTEDLVGLLFSKPEYKFKEIFSEHKELRVIPLIHYSAILFYISRLLLWKKIKLPRTVSFSGKGSEYLDLLFLSNNNLKGFTQKMLGIFTGEQTRPDFMIAKSNEPKVITAKGAVHYAVEDVTDDTGDDWGNDQSANQNNGEKRLIRSNITYKGFKNFDLENELMTYSSLLNDNKLYEDVMNNHVDFFNLLFDNHELCNLINSKLEIKDFAKYKQFFIPANGTILNDGTLRDSFKATLASLTPSDNITDSPFFFALNYSLTELSREIANSSVNP